MSGPEFEPVFNRQTSEAEVRALEQRLGTSLPDDYRAFLLARNGGRPTPRAFPIAGEPGGGTSLLEWLLGIAGRRDTYDLVTVRARFAGRVPGDLLPVARDPGGNLVCLQLSGPDR